MKDLRYSLDTVGEGNIREPIELCKLLQKELGNWHDTIVHRDLLKVIERELGHTEQAALAAVADLETELDKNAGDLREVSDTA